MKIKYCPFCGIEIDGWESKILPDKLYGIDCDQCGKWVVSKSEKGVFIENKKQEVN